MGDSSRSQGYTTRASNTPPDSVSLNDQEKDYKSATQDQNHQNYPTEENAFSNQLEMTQVEAPNQQQQQQNAGHYTGFSMGHMVQALPQYQYRPEYYIGPQSPPHFQQRYPQTMQYSEQPHVQMHAHMAPYGTGVVGFTGQQPYYIAPQMAQDYYPVVPQMGNQMIQSTTLRRTVDPFYRPPPLVVNGRSNGYAYPPPITTTSYNAYPMQPRTGPMMPPSRGSVDMTSHRCFQSLGGGQGLPQLDVDGERAEPDDIDGKNGQTTTIVRGPPRKPRQSGHAIWIGNLPPQTVLMGLVQHVCSLAPGLESLFLISKSNCAFANFKDEAICSDAQKAIHDSIFQSMRLVSRLRKSTAEGVAGVAALTGLSLTTAGQPLSDTVGVVQGGEPQVIVAPPTAPASAPRPITRHEGEGVAPTISRERYFILKSLTVEDLNLSVRTGVWATQSHNEIMLTNAYKFADRVYLIFSANKSGEYFGVARMTSSINADPNAAVEFAPKSQAADDLVLPQSYITEATEAAPKGSVIDDSARGTIFWEADRADDVGSEHVDGEVDDMVDGEADDGPKTWGKPFKLEWLSTNKLPFYRTRGLRNPWNANREVKIARDGTELEPSVGRRLVALFMNGHNRSY